MKDIFKFSFRMALVQFAAAVLSFICLFMLYGSDIAVQYKMLAGLFFIGFTLFLIWNNATTKGEKDAKGTGANYHPLKGYLAGALAMLLPMGLTLVYVIINIKGYVNTDNVTPTILYLLLYVIFLPYAQILSAFTAVSPNLNFDFVQPSIVYHDSVTSGNAVMSYMFFVPVIVFIIATGLCYTWGYKLQKKSTQKAKDKLENDKIL